MELRVAAKVDAADREYFETIRHTLDEPHVKFLKEIGDADKCALLSNAAALLFPIDWPEPFGLVMIEAMACGTPVVAFRRGSIPEIVEDGRSGIIVEDVDQAVRALERVMKIPRKGCRQAFEERFLVSRMAQDYIKIYDRLLEEQPLVTPFSLRKGLWTRSSA